MRIALTTAFLSCLSLILFGLPTFYYSGQLSDPAAVAYATAGILFATIAIAFAFEAVGRPAPRRIDKS